MFASKAVANQDFPEDELSYYYGPQQSRGKVMFLHVCVILFTLGSAPLHAGIHTPLEPGTPLGPGTPPGPGTPLGAGTPPHTVHAGRYGLHECNLVWHNFCRKLYENKGNLTDLGARVSLESPCSASLCEKEPCAKYYLSVEDIASLPNIKVLNKDAFSFVRYSSLTGYGSCSFFVRRVLLYIE